MEKELPKLDLKDKKILACLEKDARTPASEIAKKAGLSKPSVIARIARLKKEGVIERFIIHVGFRSLGLTNYRLYLKFQNVPAGFEADLAQFLKTDGRVRWFCICSGEWDVIIRAMAKDIYEFRDFEQAILSRFGASMQSRAFSIILNDAYHYCTYLTGNEGISSNPEKEYSGKPYAISETDAKTLYWLFEDARMPYSELAAKLKAKPEVASYHAKKLLNAGVITGSMAKISRPALGYLEAKVLLWLQYLTPQEMGKFRKYCESHQYVSFFGEIIGPWDMEVDFDVKNHEHLYEILREIRSKFPQLVKEYKVVNKIREFEVNFMAKRAGIAIPKS